ncbi:diguanylate cyclase [Pseudohalioglobus sediminis]|uniref:diguanylate cyclase n=1 Tax=Pseudohalioglobus sediminis TaxID=2606449 RepID=A0A5B0WR31_9GAMM|nr:diguanylate cyclase [Pseudohalioglobus sediminis]
MYPTTTNRAVWPLLALIFAVCLLTAGQWARAQSVPQEIPRVSAENLGEGLSLRGQWRFRPGDDVNWADPALEDKHWQTLRVPERWPMSGYPEYGHMGWYRLTLGVDPALHGTRLLEEVAVKMGKVLSAYELYAGGELIGSVGRLPPLNEVDYDRERVFSIPQSAVAADGRLVLALRVWGGEAELVEAWGAGAISGSYVLGYHRDLLIDAVLAEVPGLILAVLTFFFGCYHLYLYWRNRSLETFFWFGLMACNIAIYGVMLTQWKYATDLTFLTMKKIEFGAVYLFPAVAIQMIWSLLRLPIKRWLRAYQLTFVLAALLVVAIPGHTVHYLTLEWWQLLCLPSMVLAPWVLFRETRAGNAEARTVLLGTLIFVCTALNDMLIDLVPLESPRLAPLGFLAVLVSMMVSLANRFTTMYTALETEVAERTAELSEANRQLARVARVDHLTGLLNRRGFTEEAEGEIRRTFRSGKPFCVVLADVDNFKQFNDQYGHVCGDHVLKRTAALLQDRLREVDRVARWGGEEFILLLPETDTEGAAVVAEKLREAVEQNLVAFDDQRLSITMTFGIAAFRKGESLDACIARADTALYHGKENGRNKVMIGNYKGLSLVN